MNCLSILEENGLDFFPRIEVMADHAVPGEAVDVAVLGCACDNAAANLAGYAIHNVEEAIELRPRVLGEEEPFLAYHTAFAGYAEDRNLINEIASPAVPSVVDLVAAGKRSVEADDAGGLPPVHPNLERVGIAYA
jgi:hypothetical protein